VNKQQPDLLEDKRLTALSAYAILDTTPQKELDAITRLASFVCKTPIALITFIDADRQWVKSSVGIDLKQVPRADAFCNHAITSNNILEIEDVLEHDAFRHNPFVVNDPQIRFYAGAPLIDPNGFKLGALCVLDMVRRKLTTEQLNSLRTLANDVVTHLVLLKQSRELKDTQARDKDLSNLFNTSPGIQCVMDKDYRIEMINKAVTDILGHNQGKAIGKVFWNLFSEGVRSSSIRQMNEGLRKGKRSFEVKTPLITGAGDIKWLNWSLVFKENKWYATGRDVKRIWIYFLLPLKNRQVA